MGKYIHHIERVEFPITFYVPWADQIGLVNVVYFKWLFKIRVLNALGYATVGKIVFRGRYVWLKVRRHLRGLFAEIRAGELEFCKQLDV